MAAGVCGPSFEARREERRAPQDDGGVLADPESGFRLTNHQPSMAVSMHTIAGLI
jgi:hypothetical protein